MALNALECEEMISACKAADRMLSIGYRLHFEPHTQEIIRLGKKRPFGDITAIDTGNGYRWGSNMWYQW